MSLESVTQLPYAFGGPGGKGVIRTEPADFRVEEITVVEPDGEGEHCLLEIEKTNTNTDWVARLLGKHAGVKPVDVSFAGMKDRHAVTTQWFSVRLAGKPEPDWSELASPGMKILQVARHGRKLRTGALKGNRFILLVREFTGDAGLLAERLHAVSEQGIPNYFGVQRFGRDGGNLDRALALFAGKLRRCSKSKRGIYLSAARSYLFNRVLAHRVGAGNWNKLLRGERFLLDGSQSTFLADEIDMEIARRFEEGDIHTTGPMWGRGGTSVSATVDALESQALQEDAEWKAGLEQAGLKMERRALRALVKELDWTLDGQDLRLKFALPKGSFATSLLRECVDVREAERTHEEFGPRAP